MVSNISIDGKEFRYFDLNELEEKGYSVKDLPYSTKILLENLLRKLDGKYVTEDHIRKVMERKREEIPFYPSRVILQDYTGVPAIVDLIAMRNAAKRRGIDPEKVNPVIPVELVADHSLQVDKFGTRFAIFENRALEYKRNGERYSALKWAQKNFRNLRIVPPGNGIVHQVNIEFLARVVMEKDGVLYPDTLIGTDSHTTMVNGISVLGWGVGGLEAEAVIVGEPSYILVPEVVGVRLIGKPVEGVTATDIVLSITEFLRKSNVVGKFVEFYGDGMENLSAQDRTTISNMSPEYGATIGYFPASQATLDYLYQTGRSREHISIVKKYLKKQGLFYDGREKRYDQKLEFDLSKVEPSIAGPTNPEDRISLKNVPAISRIIREANLRETGSEQSKSENITIRGDEVKITDGAVAIAAITSCTNTSNPDVLIGAALVARNAIERGLKVKSYVKTSFAPGSPVVAEYLNKAGLTPYLEGLGFHIVGYGCTTCIGNSGPLIKEVEEVIKQRKIYTAAVLSGNRNFEGRINPFVKGSFLASPMLVVAYAISGRIDIDFEKEPVGIDPNGNPVFLRDIWPDKETIRAYEKEFMDRKMYLERREKIFEGIQEWKDLQIPEGNVYRFDERSTYVRDPPWFDVQSALKPIENAMIFAIFGDRITTDHISPAGNIIQDYRKYEEIWQEYRKNGKAALSKAEIPAARYLMENDVAPTDFNTYGARRGNHEVMVRGGFSNPKIRNLMVGEPGGYTVQQQSKTKTTFFDASTEYRASGTPLVIVAGKMYGVGSSRDWAAKATYLLGVRAVIAQSFERIHRNNLTNMGVIPVEADTTELGLKGDETISITWEKLYPGAPATITISGNVKKTITGKIRLDTQAEIDYCEEGNILNYTLKKLQ